MSHMGFRGSRVQTPPSRLVKKSSPATTSVVGLFLPRRRARLNNPLVVHQGAVEAEIRVRGALSGWDVRATRVRHARPVHLLLRPILLEAYCNVTQML